MKKSNLLILMILFFISVYSQERTSAERIEFLIDNPIKLTRADGWRINDEGDWTKNQNIMSGNYEDIWNSLPTNFNFKEFYFNKFEYKNNLYYCLILEKFQTRYEYPSIREDPFLTNEIHYFIFRPEHYLSFVEFINNKQQGIKLIKPIAEGECSSLTSELTDKYVRFEMTKKLEFYFDLLKYAISSSQFVWENDRKTRKLYKTYDDYLKSRIEEHDTLKNDNRAFAINYLINGKEVFRFLLPFYNMSFTDENRVKNLFTNTYFEVPRNEFINILVD
jgi:hypothetical protein